MKESKSAPRDMDEYIAGFPRDVQAILQQVRKTIRKAVPEAEEAIKYQVPFRIDSFLGRRLVGFLFRVVFHRLITVETPLGRKARPKVTAQGGPRIRVKSEELSAA